MSGVPIFANGAQTAAIQYVFNQLSMDHKSASDAEKLKIIRQIDDELEVVRSAINSEIPAELGSTFYPGRISSGSNSVALEELSILEYQLEQLKYVLTTQSTGDAIGHISPSVSANPNRARVIFDTIVNTSINLSSAVNRSFKVNAYVDCYSGKSCRMYAE